MKKLIIGVLVFALISFCVTGVLIKVKNGKLGFENNEIVDNVLVEGNESANNPGNVTEKPKEKTIDLYGTYDENDLLIEDIVEKIELSTMTVELEIPKIKGLKDKSIENKVNNDIKNRIVEKVSELSNQEHFSVVSSRTETTYQCGSFSNVISYTWHISYKVANESKSENICLNYELVTGERLKFEDLFIENADIQSIVRKMLYRVVASGALGGEGRSEVYYDEEKNKWMVVDYWYGENDEEMPIEYIPSITEDDISEKISAFMNTQEKNFYFTPTKIYIMFNEDYYTYYLYFKDIADDVVIYDKYVSDESLYETNDIGLKNLWTCSEPLSRFYMNYGFLEENLYYDINVENNNYIETTGYPFKKSLRKIRTNLIEDNKNKLEKYRKIAKENPDKFFILGINSYADVNENNILLFTRINEYLTTTDISYKKDVMDELLGSYRYYNLVFYDNVLEYAGYTYDRNDNEYYQGKVVFDNFEKEEDSKVYDARTLKEITSVDEIFKNSSAHGNIPRDNLILKLTNEKPELDIEEIIKLVEESEFILTPYGIEAKVPGFDYRIWMMNYQYFNKSILNIYDLDMYVIPDSNTRRIEKSEIENLSSDELNRAYNEIFARYGHSFKSKDLREYFELCSWYTPIENKSVTLEELSEIEKYNLDIIKSVIAEKK